MQGLANAGMTSVVILQPWYVQAISAPFFAKKRPLEKVVELAKDLPDFCAQFTSKVRHA